MNLYRNDSWQVAIIIKIAEGNLTTLIINVVKSDQMSKEMGIMYIKILQQNL